MEYITTNGRCAVNLNSLNLPISNDEALKILKAKSFEVIDIDLIKLARKYIGAPYHRSIKISEAPAVFDCSSFTKYLYSQKGIWLPRRSIQQRALGEPVELEKITAGDLVFTSGSIDYYLDNPLDGVGHVGIATNDHTVIHAANKEKGVIESPLTEFTKQDKFRGARRYIPADVDIVTFIIPPSRDVEFSDDIKWIILQSL